MKRFGEALTWAGALLVAGAFLLLKNLGVFGEWGDLIWGALFAAVGLGFLIWFVVDLQRWWRVIPGFTLLGVGGWIILQVRAISLGEWGGALVLFAMALGFWSVLLVRGEHWWSVIPAGVLTVLGLLFGLWSRLTDLGRMAVLVVGIGLVFALLYVIRFGQRDTRWAALPAASLLLLGLVTVMELLGLPEWVSNWWPSLLVVAGLGVGIGVLGLRGASRPAAPPVVPDFDAPARAPGTSVTDVLPEVAGPPRPVQPDAGPIDIYDLIKQQPEGAAPAPVQPESPAAEPAPGDHLPEENDVER